MTSLLARLGQFESRLIPTTRWPTGKRKRARWVCSECRDRTVSDPRRLYSDHGAVSSTERALRPIQRSEPRTFIQPARAKPHCTGPQVRVYHAGLADNGMKALAPALEPREGTQLQETDGSWIEKEEDWDTDSAIDHEILMSQTVSSDGRPPETRPSDIPLLNIDYKAMFEPALLDRSADTVFRCLLAASEARDFKFMRRISQFDFTKAIGILQPRNTIAEFANVHYELSRAKARVMGVMPLTHIAREFSQALQDVVNMRRKAQGTISLDDYKMLLRGARDLGDVRMAGNLWNQLTRDGIVPDTDCYNHYMGAVVWKHGHDNEPPPSQQRLPSASEVVRKDQRRRREIPHAKFLLGAEYIQKRTMKIFSEMLSAQVSPNEQSFILTMLAAAKAGDLSTVKSTLRRVWSVDVDVLMEQAGERQFREHVVTNKGVPPTDALLFAVAHIFGINNDIPTALRTVDHIAQRFDLVIPQDVWNQLFEWTFAMSTRRTSLREITQDLKEGQLPRRSALELWNTMTSEPYNVKPTMGMYDRLVRNLSRRQWPSEMYRYMNEGHELCKASRADAESKYQAFRQAAKQAARKGNTPHSTITSRQLEDKRRAFEAADLIRSRDHRWLIEWVHLLLKTMPSWLRTDGQGDWPLREIPRMLWDWRHAAPKRVSYVVHGGSITFDLHDRQRRKRSFQAKNHRRGTVHALLDNAPVLVGQNWAFRRDPSQESARSRESNRKVRTASVRLTQELHIASSTPVDGSIELSQS